MRFPVMPSDLYFFTLLKTSLMRGDELFITIMDVDGLIAYPDLYPFPMIFPRNAIAITQDFDKPILIYRLFSERWVRGIDCIPERFQLGTFRFPSRLWRITCRLIGFDIRYGMQPIEPLPFQIPDVTKPTAR